VQPDSSVTGFLILLAASPFIYLYFFTNEPPAQRIVYLAGVAGFLVAAIAGRCCCFHAGPIPKLLDVNLCFAAGWGFLVASTDILGYALFSARLVSGFLATGLSLVLVAVGIALLIVAISRRGTWYRGQTMMAFQCIAGPAEQLIYIEPDFLAPGTFSELVFRPVLLVAFIVPSVAGLALLIRSGHRALFNRLGVEEVQQLVTGLLILLAIGSAFWSAYLFPRFPASIAGLFLWYLLQIGPGLVITGIAARGILFFPRPIIKNLDVNLCIAAGYGYLCAGAGLLAACWQAILAKSGVSFSETPDLVSVFVLLGAAGLLVLAVLGAAGLLVFAVARREGWPRGLIILMIPFIGGYAGRSCPFCDGGLPEVAWSYAQKTGQTGAAARQAA
jgi:hypothetical protein